MKSLSGSLQQTLPSPTLQAPGQPAVTRCVNDCYDRDGPVGATIVVTRRGQIVAYCAPCATRLQMAGGSLW